jgi:hypothetical protein
MYGGLRQICNILSYYRLQMITHKRYKINQTRKKRKLKGGKIGKMHRILNFSKSDVKGSGGYGIIVSQSNSKHVYKLLKDINACNELQQEIKIHQHISSLMEKYLPEIRVPKITHFTMEQVTYNSKPYLCGIEMEYMEPPNGFNQQVHMLLGYNQDDIDEEWGVMMAEPVSTNNPTRGFFASPDTLEAIWEEEGSYMTIERLSYLMGKASSILLKNGILPIDVEWVWSKGKPTLLDFGLCEYGQIEPKIFLQKKGLRGLADDFYIPHQGDRGYNEFMVGFAA